MPWREYRNCKRQVMADGTTKLWEGTQRRWAKTMRRKPQKKGAERPSIVSSRFGLLDLYNRKEQQQLICPSGYSISQCFNVLGKLWHGYHRARLENEGIAKMEKYAKAIQNVQKDMGIKTTSFPHLGIYGDVFILNDKNDKRIVFEDHSAMKKKQEEFEKWQAQNSKQIQEHIQKPNKEAGEEIVTFPDDEYSHKVIEIEIDEDEIVPHLCAPDEEAGEKLIVMTDDIPFLNNHNKKKNTEKTSPQDS